LQNEIQHRELKIRGRLLYYKLKKEQQKNRCSTASGFYGLTVMPCGSLKQKLATHQDFFQNPNPKPFRRPQNSTAGTFV